MAIGKRADIIIFDDLVIDDARLKFDAAKLVLEDFVNWSWQDLTEFVADSRPILVRASSAQTTDDVKYRMATRILVGIYSAGYSRMLELEYDDGSMIRVGGQDGDDIFQWCQWNFPGGLVPRKQLEAAWGVLLGNYGASAISDTKPLPLLVRCPGCGGEVPMTEKEIGELSKDGNDWIAVGCKYSCDVRISRLKDKIKEARSR